MLKLTLVAALAGSADTASFAVTRRDVLKTKPDRAAGTLVSLGLWLGVARSAATDARGQARRLAALALLANAAMLGMHVRARIANPRVYAGAALAAVALAGTLRK